jgi:hypothetical protein
MDNDESENKLDMDDLNVGDMIIHLRVWLIIHYQIYSKQNF